MTAFPVQAITLFNFRGTVSDALGRPIAGVEVIDQANQKGDADGNPVSQQDNAKKCRQLFKLSVYGNKINSETGGPSKKPYMRAGFTVSRGYKNAEMDWLGVEWSDNETSWFHAADQHWRTATYRSQWFDEDTCDLEWTGNWTRTFPKENGNPNDFQPSTSGPHKSPVYTIWSGKIKEAGTASVTGGAVYGTMLPQGWSTDGYPAECGGRSYFWNTKTRRMGSIVAVIPEEGSIKGELGGIYARFVHWNRVVDWSYCWIKAVNAVVTRKASAATDAALYCFNPPAREEASLDMSTEPLRHQY